MLIREIAEQLEISIDKANYYRQVLKKHDLLNPEKDGNRLDYTESDVHYFHTLHKYTTHDKLTASEAIRYINEGVTPSQALDKLKQVNAQLEAAQKKIVELRKPTMWEKIRKFFGKFKIFGKDGDSGSDILSKRTS